MSMLTVDPHMLSGCVSARRHAGCCNGYISRQHAVTFHLAACRYEGLPLAFTHSLGWLHHLVVVAGSSTKLMCSGLPAEVKTSTPRSVNTRGRAIHRTSPFYSIIGLVI